MSQVAGRDDDPAAGATYILTAELDPASFVWLDGLRRQHFPPQRNVLPAHLTLFHKLTATQITRLNGAILSDANIEILFDAILFLGSGVAIRVASPKLERLRSDARKVMGEDFSRQDLQPWRPHVTIQNKVAVEAARRLQRGLETEFLERRGAATGLLVWEYLGGPWKLATRIPFSEH